MREAHLWCFVDSRGLNDHRSSLEYYVGLICLAAYANRNSQQNSLSPLVVSVVRVVTVPPLNRLVQHYGTGICADKSVISEASLRLEDPERGSGRYDPIEAETCSMW